MTTPKKNAEEVTEKGKAQAQAYAFGVEGRPYPMTEINEETGTRDLGVLEGAGNHITVHSELSYEQMIGTAYRDMPAPGMLHIFKQGLEKRQPGSRNLVEAILGDPGSGKSFIANMQARMRTKRGAVLVDCGGRDLSELLYEAVMDKSANKNLYDAFDSALANNELNPVSVAQLKSALGSAFKQEDGRASVDWEEVAHARIDVNAQEKGKADIFKAVAEKHNITVEEAQNLQLSEKDSAVKTEVSERISKLGEQLQQAANARRDKAIEALDQVAIRHKLMPQGSSGFSLTVREGPMIRAWKENRPIILDEYNKSKPGTDDKLQILWQVFIGEMESHTVHGGNGESFTFDRAETPDQFFLTITGNQTKDGSSTRPLSKSAIDRIKPEVIEPLSVQDLQHRICQKLTGLPVSTIYAANEDKWQSRKPEFKEWLTKMRKIGLSEEKVANIPSWQFAMIQNADRVMAASEQVAEFYHKWSEALIPDSETNLNLPGAAQDEVTEPSYQNEVTVGMRRLMENLDQAVLVTSKVTPSYLSKGVNTEDDWTQPPEVPFNEPEDVEKGFGTRLERVILEAIYSTTSKQPAMRKWLLEQAEDLNIKEPTTAEAAKLQHTRLAARLNLDPELNKIPEGLEETHGLLADYIRRKFSDEKGLQLSDDDLDIISPAALAESLTQIENQTEIDRPGTRSGVVYLPNLDEESSMSAPVTGAVGQSGNVIDFEKQINDPGVTPETKQLLQKLQAEEAGLENLTKYPTEDLVDAERFLISLAIPTLKSKNLEGVWNQYSSSANVAGPNDEPNEAELIAENRHPSGIATQLLLCKTKDENGQEQDEYLFVVHDRLANNGKGKTLVTGTSPLNDRLISALDRQDVTYVNRNDADAEVKISSELDKLLKDKKPDSRVLSPFPMSYQVAESLIRYSLPPDRNEVVVNDDGEEVEVLSQNGSSYQLPHQEIIDGSSSKEERMTPAWGQKAKLNLVALLSDKEGYLEQNQGDNTPFILTTSPDLDSLRHVLRALQTPETNKEQSGPGI